MKSNHELLADLIAALGEMEVLMVNKSSDIDELDKAMEKVFKDVLVLDTHHSKDLIVLKHAFDNFNTDLRKLFDDFCIYFEKQVVDHLLEGKISIDTIIKERQKVLVAHEQKIIHTHFGTGQHKTLFAGCGAFPVSAILHSLADRTMQLDLLDMSPSALEYAQRILKKFGLDVRTSILSPVKVEDYDRLEEYDIILMASMIGFSPEEKEHIYKGVSAHLPSQKYILTRYAHPESFSSLLYSTFPFDELKSLFTVKVNNRATPPLLSSQLLLQRK